MPRAHPSRRAIVPLLGVVLIVVALAGAVASRSASHVLYHDRAGLWLQLERAGLHINRGERPPETAPAAGPRAYAGWQHYRLSGSHRVAWSPGLELGEGAWRVSLPLWTLLACGAAMLLPRLVSRVRRTPEGRCEGCQYDRAGLSAAAPCPECGHQP